MNKRFLACLLLAAIFTGCRAEMIEKKGDSIQLFGKKPPKGGVVRYLNGGMKAWRDARRKDAEKQMTAFCKGPYKILAEGPRSKFGADMPIGKSVTVEMDEYTYVRFECENQSVP